MKERPREARVYQAEVLPERVWKWVVAWRTPIMPCSAYNYYDDEQEARQFAKSILEFGK